MQNVVINVREKFHYDRLKNDKALGNGISDNNSKKNNDGGHLEPVSGSHNLRVPNLVIQSLSAEPSGLPITGATVPILGSHQQFSVFSTQFQLTMGNPTQLCTQKGSPSATKYERCSCSY